MTYYAHLFVHKLCTIEYTLFKSIIKLLDEKEAMTTESPESKPLLTEETMTTETKKFEVNDTNSERDDSTAATGTKLNANGMGKEQTDTTNEENKPDKVKERKMGRLKGTVLIFI